MQPADLDVLIAEHGAEVPVLAADASAPLVLQQRPGESARSFSQRVARSLSARAASGQRVERAGLWVSPARGSASTHRRFSLARVLLSGMRGRSNKLTIGGPVVITRRGRLDMTALAATLTPLLGGSATIEVLGEGVGEAPLAHGRASAALPVAA